MAKVGCHEMNTTGSYLFRSLHKQLIPTLSFFVLALTTLSIERKSGGAGEPELAPAFRGPIN